MKPHFIRVNPPKAHWMDAFCFVAGHGLSVVLPIGALISGKKAVGSLEVSTCVLVGLALLLGAAANRLGLLINELSHIGFFVKNFLKDPDAEVSAVGDANLRTMRETVRRVLGVPDLQ